MDERKTEISFLSSSKYTVADKKVMLIGSVTETIYNHIIFKNNSDLKEYTNIFEEYFKSTVHNFSGYKEYLFKSRTLLASRIARMIFEANDSVGIRKLIDSHLAFIRQIDSTKNSEKSKRRSQKRESSLLDDFIDKDK